MSISTAPTRERTAGPPLLKRRLTWVLLVVGQFFNLISVHAVEATWEYAVQVSAVVQSSPPQISLSWPQDTVVQPSSYTVYRKGLLDTSWGAGTVLSGTTTSYVDNNVVDGSAYEYQVVKATSAYTGYGYIYAGMDVPLTEGRGKVVLIVDNTYSAALSNQLARLQQDLVGDGWMVLRHDVSRTNGVGYVKSLIRSDYNSDPNNVNTVFLLGHVAVPYSGDIAPDGHGPEHRGAWPADVYYADMAGTWTDSSVNDTNATDPRDWNVPGDGKFDQNTIPSPVQLMVGRVDLYNLPGETTWDGPPTLPDETTLMGNYLDKDHAYRQKQFDLPRRGLVGDYFGVYTNEAFAASGWRNFAPFFGAANITMLPNQGTWLNTLNSYGYLWSYGCGSGGYNSIAGLGNDDQYYTAITPDFYTADIQSVFVMLFGSWFGDWDSQDDLMRGVLATPHYGLACMWSGRPHWFCQHMALGMTLGFSTRLTQNDTTNGLYRNMVNTHAGQVHVALMGDPTLRMHTVGPPANLAGALNASGLQLSWNSSPDSVLGYDIYRASDPNGPFTRLNGSLATSNGFIDPNPAVGTQTYMVRAVKLESSASGTYFNASEGIFFAFTLAAPAVVTVAATTPNASRVGLVPGAFTVSRQGDTSAALTAGYSMSGTASRPGDYQVVPSNNFGSITIPAGAASTTLTVQPQPSSTWVDAETVQLTLTQPSGQQYVVGAQSNALVTIQGNGIDGLWLRISNSAPRLTWPSAAGRTYHVAYEGGLNGNWTDFGIAVNANSTNTAWTDTSGQAAERFYRVFETK